MKALFISIVTLLTLSCCTTREAKFQTKTVRIPVIEKYSIMEQFSVFPAEKIWIAKLANGDSIKTRSYPPDTVTFIYYVKVK